MIGCLRFWSLTGALLIIFGCGSKDITVGKADSEEIAPSLPPDEPPSSQPVETKTDDPDRLAQLSKPSNRSEAPEEHPKSDGGNEAPREEKKDEGDGTVEPRPTKPSSYAIWMPTTKGGLLVGLDISVGDLELGTLYSQHLDAVMAQSGDPPSWSKFLQYVRSEPALFGQNVRQLDGRDRDLIKRYDRNEDRLVDADEAARFLFRDTSSPSELRIVGTSEYRWSNRSNSVLFRAMDLNEDWQLDSTEISRSAESILSKVDQNSDGCIDFSEVSREPETGMGPWGRRRSTRSGDVAMDLFGYINWSNVAFAMGGHFGPSPFLGQRSVLAPFDLDKDGTMSEEECSSVPACALPITVSVRYADGRSDAPFVEIKLEGSSESVKQFRVSESQVVLTDHQNFDLIVHASERSVGAASFPRQAFDQLDANNDGFLEESEIPDEIESQFDFETLDDNNDDKLSFYEIRRGTPLDRSIWSSQVRGRAAEFPAGIFAALDLNHDQLLSSREIANAPVRITSFADEDQPVKPEHFPDTYLLQLIRGEPQQDATQFAISQRRPAEDPRPSWAARMDANHDGEIAKVEFPGTVKQFESIDRDADGFLSADEVNSL